MGRENLQRLDANRGHEHGIPLTRPSGTLSPAGGEGWGEGAARFMKSTCGSHVVSGDPPETLRWATAWMPSIHLLASSLPKHFGEPPKQTAGPAVLPFSATTIRRAAGDVLYLSHPFTEDPQRKDINMLKIITGSNSRKWGTFAAAGLITLGLMFLPEQTGISAAAANSWTGTWNNKKFKTTGPLTCTVTSQRGNTWQAVFTGTGLGRPFRYPATFTVREANGRTTIQAVTSVGGERYQWAGVISGKTLGGSYRSATGNNGSFQLQSR